MFNSSGNNKNPHFGTEGDNEPLTVSFMETGKKKLHLGAVVAVLSVWLGYVAFDRVVRVNIQKYHMKKALERSKIEQVEAGRRAKKILSKSVRYKRVSKVRRVKKN